MEEKIGLSTPHLSGKEQDYIQEALRSNWVTQGGPYVEAFEKKLEAFYSGGTGVAALNSGTAAIHLALVMLGIGQGDVVICQSLTFTASANPILYLGAVPVFVDSEISTWNICPTALEDAVKKCIKAGKKPKAIITVTLYGMPYRVEEVHEVASRYEIPVIEDSAEALGSKYRGKNCGTFGDFGILSFNGNKIITTSGGGALLLKKERKQEAVFLATQAKDPAPHYEHSKLGYNYRMSNVSAALGCAQMEVLEERIMQRRKNHVIYKKLFANFAGIKLFAEPSGDYESNHWLNVITFSEDTKREEARERMLRKNIEVRPVWKPLHLQPLFRGALYVGGNTAEELFKKGLCLPSGTDLREEQLEKIVLCLKT